MRSTVSHDEPRNAHDQGERARNERASTQDEREERVAAGSAPKISAGSVVAWSMVTLLVASLLLVGFFVISIVTPAAKPGHGGGDVGVGKPQDN